MNFVSRNKKQLCLLTLGALVIGLTIAAPVPAFASFESSLIDMKSKLAGVVLPLLSVIGLLIASFSYLTGHPNCRQHMIYALIGAGVGFGSQAIIDFISSTIH